MKQPNITIRKGKQCDVLPVYRMGYSKELRNPTGNPPKKWWVESFVKEKQFFYIVEVEKKIVGFLLAERTSGDVVQIQEIYVKKEFRNKRIGTKLIKLLEEESKKRKMKAIILYSYEGKDSPTKFYERESFAKGNLTREMIKFL